MKFPTPYETGIMREDQAEARACNVDLPKPQVNMLNNRQDVRAREARLKRHIVTNLSKISITKIHLKKHKDDQLSFNKKEAEPHPYPRVLIILVPVTG